MHQDKLLTLFTFNNDTIIIIIIIIIIFFDYISYRLLFSTCHRDFNTIFNHVLSYCRISFSWNLVIKIRQQ